MYEGNLIKILVERAAAIELRGWMEGGGGCKRFHGTSNAHIILLATQRSQLYLQWVKLLAWAFGMEKI